jgi:hypothetical protein
MQTYKVLVYNTSRYFQWVLVQANSEEEAEGKVQFNELWDKDSWLLDNEHCEVDYVETAEEEEEVPADLSEATHIWINQTLYDLSGKNMLGVTKWIEHGQTYGIKITSPFLDSFKNTQIDKVQFALLGIRPVKRELRKPL